MSVDNLSGDQFYGRGLESLFPEGSSGLRTVPWKEQGRMKAVQDYDPDLVKETLQRPPELSEIDPRELRASQPSVTRAGVAHYAGLHSPYPRTGETFADKGNVGNKFPFVYHREGQAVILAGHHRAAAALVKGEPLRAIQIEGPFGPPRSRR